MATDAAENSPIFTDLEIQDCKSFIALAPGCLECSLLIMRATDVTCLENKFSATRRCANNSLSLRLEKLNFLQKCKLENS